MSDEEVYVRTRCNEIHCLLILFYLLHWATQFGIINYAVTLTVKRGIGFQLIAAVADVPSSSCPLYLSRNNIV